MYALAIIAVGLYFILLIGVGYIVIKFLKELLDSRVLEKKTDTMTSDFRKFKANMDENLKQLKKESQELNEQYNSHLNEMQKEMCEMEHDVDEIFDYAQKLTDLNACLYDKLALIDSVLNENPTHEQIDKLRETLQNDIAERKEYQSYLEKYEQERRQRVKGSFYQGFSR